MYLRYMFLYSMHSNIKYTVVYMQLIHLNITDNCKTFAFLLLVPLYIHLSQGVLHENPIFSVLQEVFGDSPHLCAWAGL